MRISAVSLSEIAEPDSELVAEGDKPSAVWRHDMTVGPFSIHFRGFGNSDYAIYVASGREEALRIRGNARGTVPIGDAFRALMESPESADMLEGFVLPAAE